LPAPQVVGFSINCMEQAYQVIARRWRPKQFDELVGQDHIVQTLRNAIEGKRIAHAYLFRWAARNRKDQFCPPFCQIA
jgi:hypothetical protein